MSEEFDLGGITLEPWSQADSKDRVKFFGKTYRWERISGRLTLTPLAAGGLRLEKWPCCGRLRVL